MAQVWEKDFWANVWTDDRARQTKARSYWEHYIAVLKEYARLKTDDRVLDVGCGPFGMISYLAQGQRFGLDSLMHFYLASFDMEKEVTWASGGAESLPFDDAFFDVVICTNTIDHTRVPQRALAEMNRVLKSDGVLFLTVHIYSRRVRTVKAFLERVGWGDPPHPYSFNVPDVKRLLSESGFKLTGLRHGIGNLDFWVGGEKTGDPKTFVSRTRDYGNRAVAIGRSKGARVLFKTLVRFALLFLLMDTQRSADTIFLARKKASASV
ncbi:MAG: class I SAM-dependent methyltransferase [Chloroflexi bacterium]|nr:class I SAM-dependent methyltransferase [Chloroflexota bacterium]